MAEYVNPAQYGSQAFTWDPAAQVFSSGIQENAPGYLTELLGRLEQQRRGELPSYQLDELNAWQAAARAIPTRDIASLTPGWQGELQGQWTDEGWREGAQDWWTRLDPGSPDAGPIMLAIRDRMAQGTATPQERSLFQNVMGMATDWDYRASAPQESDASPFGLGDQLFGALMTIGLGATGGLAAAPLVAGGATAATTLGSIGTLSGIAGTGAGVIGQATDQPWLQSLGLGLGALGGIAGGAGGLANLWTSGVQNLGDAARLAQSASRITGAVGSASGNEGLRQASRYLGQAGQLGQFGSSFLPTSVTNWSGSGAPLASNVAPQVSYNTQGAPLTTQDWSTQRGGAPMSEFDYSWDYGGGTPYDDWSMGGDVYAGGSPTFNEGGGDYFQSPAYQQFIGGGDPYGPGSSGDPNFTGEGSGGFWGTLGSLGSAALGFLGKNAGILGPAASALGSLGGGAIGSNAASDAARLQANALNRGIDLQTAQWLQQQANQAPWLQAGQQALPQLQQLAGRGAPGPFQSGWGIVKGSDYALPGTRPGWDPQTYQGPQAPNAGDYRWTPGQGPRAGDYRYTPGQVPDASAYRWTPGQGPQAGDYRYTPGAVPTLSGKELLANDPGVQFRMEEGRKALESSAAARGGLLSGPTLAALQRQGQELSSQEYGQAFARASQQAQMREAWNQTAQQMGFSQAQTEAAWREQMAQQSSQQGFGQAMDATRLREQVNQVAMQQGWSQAQAEAVFREQMAQQASQQGFAQALAGQGQQFTQGLTSQQWNQQQAQQWQAEQYKRAMEQNQLQYGRDWQEVETGYARDKDWYNSMLQQQSTDWNRYATLAGLGQTATGQLGQQGQAAQTNLSSLLAQLGSAQGVGAYGSGLSWQNALTGAGNQLPSLLRSLNA